jgi:hypothetical protein
MKPALFSEPREKKTNQRQVFEGGGKKDPYSGLQNGFL